MVPARFLWFATFTRGVAGAWDHPFSTDSDVYLRVRQDGDLVFDKTIPDTSQEDFEQGVANLYPIQAHDSRFDPGRDAEVTVGIGSDDYWGSDLRFVWAERSSNDPEHAHPSRRLIPLAYDGYTAFFSTDRTEGVSRQRIRSVRAGDAQTRIRQLFVAAYTANVTDADTVGDVNLVWTDRDGNRGAHNLGGQTRGAARFYHFDLPRSTSLDALRTVWLTIDDDDAWRPRYFFVFGLDRRSASGNPDTVVPVVGLSEGHPGWLSTDPSEGSAGWVLPLLKG